MPVETEDSPTEQTSFANRLARAGYEDFYVIGSEEARKLLTEKRLELLEALNNTEFSSVRELSRILSRDVKQVSEDLELLNRKIPELKHEKIFIEPVT